MNDKEKLQVEIARVRLVMEEAERKGEQFKASLLAWKIREAENAIFFVSQRGIVKWLKELEGIR